MLWQQGKAYSQDLRERVFATSDDGARVGQIARLLRVSVSYVSKVLGRRRTTGETAARPQHGHMPPKLVALHAAIQGARSDHSVSRIPISRFGKRFVRVSAESGYTWRRI